MKQTAKHERRSIVYLDGRQQRDVVWADAVAGKLERCVRADGKFVCDGNRVKTEVVSGDVRVVRPERL